MTLGLWADRATSIFSKSSTEGAEASSISSCVARLELSLTESIAMETCQSRYDCPTKSGSILRTFNLSNPLRWEPFYTQPAVSLLLTSNTNRWYDRCNRKSEV